MGFAAVMAVVPLDKEAVVVTAAKAAGATGATVLEARGTGAKEALTFFGLALEERYNLVLTLVNEDLVEAVLAAIKEAADMKAPGHGIAFAMPITSVVGLESQTSRPPPERSEDNSA